MVCVNKNLRESAGPPPSRPPPPIPLVTKPHIRHQSCPQTATLPSSANASDTHPQSDLNSVESVTDDAYSQHTLRSSKSDGNMANTLLEAREAALTDAIEAAHQVYKQLEAKKEAERVQRENAAKKEEAHKIWLANAKAKNEEVVTDGEFRTFWAGELLAWERDRVASMGWAERGKIALNVFFTNLWVWFTTLLGRPPPTKADDMGFVQLENGDVVGYAMPTVSPDRDRIPEDPRITAAADPKSKVVATKQYTEIKGKKKYYYAYNNTVLGGEVARKKKGDKETPFFDGKVDGFVRDNQGRVFARIKRPLKPGEKVKRKTDKKAKKATGEKAGIFDAEFWSFFR